MTVLQEYSFTKARGSLTELIDRVQRMVPVVIRPRKKSEESSVIVSRNLLLSLLRDDKMQRRIQPRFISEPDGSTTLVLDPLDIAVNEETREDAVLSAASELIEYAREYLSPENIPVYLHSPNRRSHFAIVFQVALCDSAHEVAETLSLNA